MSKLPSVEELQRRIALMKETWSALGDLPVEEARIARAAFKKTLLGEAADESLRFLDWMREQGMQSDLSYLERERLSVTRRRLCEMAIRFGRPARS